MYLLSRPAVLIQRQTVCDDGAHLGKEGGGADDLDDDADGALLTIIIVDGQGDALAVLIHAQDDELAGLGLLGDHGSFDLKENDGRVERLFFYDTIHKSSFFPETSSILLLKRNSFRP